MMKKMIVLSSVLAVALTGCVMDPYYDDDRGHRDRHGHYDRDHDGKWKHKDNRDWNRDRDNRDWRRSRY